LVRSKDEALVPDAVKESGLKECLRILEEAIDTVKTKQGDAKVILVGGGSIIIGDHINGVGKVVQPSHFAVANAVGAAVGHPNPTICSTSSYLVDWKNQWGYRKDGYTRSPISRRRD
jgi:hypothetical protein